MRLFRKQTPVVAAVQGPAIVGGLGPALMPDFGVAASEARFSANFARFGFHHGFGLTVTLPPWSASARSSCSTPAGASRPTRRSPSVSAIASRAMFAFSPGDDLQLIVATTRELASSELAPGLRRSAPAYRRAVERGGCIHSTHGRPGVRRAPAPRPAGGVLHPLDAHRPRCPARRRGRVLRTLDGYRAAGFQHLVLEPAQRDLDAWLRFSETFARLIPASAER